MTRSFGVAAVAALLATLLGSVGQIAGAIGSLGPHPGPALVVGDSMVARAAEQSPASPRVTLVGYAGQPPSGPAPSGSLEHDFVAAHSPRTVVLNWNGNNPDRFPGMQLVQNYRAEITRDIHWYLDHGVTTIILAAAVPSAFNCGPWQVQWTSSEATVPGAMLGNDHFNDLYKQLARAFPGKVFYSEKAARTIHPGMSCSPMLNGRLCVADYIHTTPYCAAVYARALDKLAVGGPLT